MAALEKLSAALFVKGEYMTFFENELKKMFGNSSVMTDIRYVGNALIGRLTDDTIAKISFVTNNIHGQYESALIKIINPKSGEVDRQSINFNDAFRCSSKEKIYIWDCGDGMVCWKNFKPTKQHYDAINLAAEQYLEMFAEPVQGMQMGM